MLAVTMFTISLWCIEKQFEDWVGDMGVIAIIPMVAFFGTSIFAGDTARPSCASRRYRAALALYKSAPAPPWSPHLSLATILAPPTL